EGHDTGADGGGAEENRLRCTRRLLQPLAPGIYPPPHRGGGGARQRDGGGGPSTMLRMVPLPRCAGEDPTTRSGEGLLSRSGSVPICRTARRRGRVPDSWW